jgi:hypothetical protein
MNASVGPSAKITGPPRPRFKAALGDEGFEGGKPKILPVHDTIDHGDRELAVRAPRRGGIARSADDPFAFSLDDYGDQLHLAVRFGTRRTLEHLRG